MLMLMPKMNRNRPLCMLHQTHIIMWERYVLAMNAIFYAFQDNDLIILYSTIR